ncbi:MAG: Rrf2 family transcriptional regulator [Solirubrobacteraceae bacterium]|nr:Rrf2 family transcriptional regulator [Solirubrobacteraceae bacterium]
MAGPANTQFAVAVHVLTMLAGMRAAPVSSELMAGSTGSNPVYLRRVLGRLREAGLVGSRPGPRGGWHLEREPADITLGDAWRAVQEGAPVFNLHAVQPDCPVGSSIATTLTGIDERLTRSVEAELDAISLLDVFPGAAQFDPADFVAGGTLRS